MWEKKLHVVRRFPTSGGSFMTLSQPEDIRRCAAFEPPNWERGARYVQFQVSNGGKSFCQFCCHIERAVRAGLRPLSSLTRAATWLLLSLMVKVFCRESVLWLSERLLQATAWKQFLGMLASATGGERWPLAVFVLSCVASTAWCTLYISLRCLKLRCHPTATKFLMTANQNLRECP